MIPSFFGHALPQKNHSDAKTTRFTEQEAIMISLNELDEAIAAILPEVRDFRHRLHRIPEIAGREFKTAAAIREALAPLGLELHRPFLQTDVVALLNRGQAKNITLRADIDALPVEEASKSCPYRSTHPGMMHACGHDGHAAMLYGAARILASLRDGTPCSVRFLFQPGEEMAGLAHDLLDAGALLDPEPDFITGLHSWPGEPYGKICTRPGVLMAAAGFFRIALHGQGGHGSLPRLAKNPIDCAADIMTACRSIVPDDCVLAFCACHAGSSNIVIPETMELKGTIRFPEMESGMKLLADFEATVRAIAEQRGIRSEFSCPLSYPPLINRPGDYERIRSLVVENCGHEAFFELPEHTMSSEDFSWYLAKYPGVFCHIGGGDSAPLHSDRFDFDDNLLPVGIRYFCLAALKLLTK